MTTTKRSVRSKARTGTQKSASAAFQRELGQRLAALRARRGLTQQQLAELVGVTRSRLAKWERGQHPPPAEALPRLAEALSTTTDVVLTGRQPLLCEGLDDLPPDRLDIVATLGRGLTRLLLLTDPARGAAALGSPAPSGSASA